MEHEYDTSERLVTPETVPDLLDLKLLVENPDSNTERVIVYCSPIMGSPSEESFLQLTQKAKVIYMVDVQKYGYPDSIQYAEQAKQKLEALTDFDENNITLIGFSEGASLAARLGHALELPKERVFLIAPITSFRPSLENWKAWREQRRYSETTNQPQTDEPYLKRLLGSPERLYSPSASKVDQFKALNRSRVQWSTTDDDLTHGLVVSGNRDFISPPGKHSSVTIDASHLLNDFIPYLNEALS